MSTQVVLITGATFHRPTHKGVAGASPYVGSKHAVEGITKSTALELANSGIRVNAAAPGSNTEMLTRFTVTAEEKGGFGVTGSDGPPRPLRGGGRWHCLSSCRTKPGSPPATSSMSTADTAPTDPVRARK
jgi:hypothetical protein